MGGESQYYYYYLSKLNYFLDVISQTVSVLKQDMEFKGKDCWNMVRKPFLTYMIVHFAHYELERRLKMSRTSSPLCSMICCNRIRA